jgi:hypothetical protein
MVGGRIVASNQEESMATEADLPFDPNEKLVLGDVAGLTDAEKVASAAHAHYATCLAAYDSMAISAHQASLAGCSEELLLAVEERAQADDDADYDEGPEG